MTAKKVTPETKKIPRTCLLDSGVLIALVNPLDVHHQNAKSYVQVFSQLGVKFYISAIAETEFASGNLADIIQYLGSENIRRLPYDHSNVRQTKELRKRHERRGASKQAHLMDMMIVSHMLNPNYSIDCVISADEKMLSFVKSEGIAAVDINVPYEKWSIADTPLFGNQDLKA